MSIKYSVQDGFPGPVLATSGSAGFDFCAPEDLVISRQGSGYIEVDTGITFEIPAGHAGLVIPRSSLGSEGLVLANTVGLIDSDYRKTVKIRLDRRTAGTTRISKGDRFAQIVFIALSPYGLERVDHIEDTGRGGFGSTGRGYVR